MNDREKAQKEYEDVIKWVLEEENRVTNKLKNDNMLLGGLDTNVKEYEYIYEERNRRIEEIRRKYNIK